MPIYEYVCQKCGHEFERIVSFSENGKTFQCPACGAEQVQRKMGRPAIHFKGSGWYITDSKKSSNGASASPSKPEKAGEASKQESSSASSEKSSESSPAKGASQE